MIMLLTYDDWAEVRVLDDGAIMLHCGDHVGRTSIRLAQPGVHDDTKLLIDRLKSARRESRKKAKESKRNG